MNDRNNKLLIAGIIVVLLVLILLGSRAIKNRNADLGGAVNLDEAPSQQDALSESRESVAFSVDSVTVSTQETFPLEASVSVTGTLSESCAQLGLERVSRGISRFDIELPAYKQIDSECTTGLFPFTHTIPLNILGLDQGEYTVSVNNVEATFEVLVDNDVSFEFDKG